MTRAFRLFALVCAFLALPLAAAQAQSACEAPAFATHISWRPLPTNSIQLIWSKSFPSESTPTSFSLEAGSAPGLLDATTIPAESVVRTNTHLAFTLSAGTYYARLQGGRTCGPTRAVSEEIQVIAGQGQGSSQVRVNEVGLRTDSALDFVELRNYGSANVNIGNWKLFTGSFNNAYFATTIPSGTIIPAGCTYLVARAGSSLISDLQATLQGRSAAIVDSYGRIRDSVAVFEDGDGGQQYPLVEGTALANRSTGSYERHSTGDSNNNTSDYTYSASTTPTAAIFCGSNSIVPSAPTLSGSVSGSTVTLSWTAPTIGMPLTQYTLALGTSPGASNVLTRTLAPTLASLALTDLANGTYYARLTAVNNAGTSPASNEVTLVVGTGGTAVPAAPTNLTASINGRTVSFTWTRPATGVTPTGYVLEAGSAPGLANLASQQMGLTESLVAANVAPGTYFVRVKALNGSTAGTASNEVTVVVQ